MKLDLTDLEAEWLAKILEDCKPTALKDSGNKYIVAQLVLDKLEDANKRTDTPHPSTCLDVSKTKGK